MEGLQIQLLVYFARFEKFFLGGKTGGLGFFS